MQLPTSLNPATVTPHREAPRVPGEVNEAFLDRYSLVHFLAGGVQGLAGSSGKAALLTAVLWEAVEDPLKDRMPELFAHPSHDARRNMAGDVVSWLAGWACGRWLDRQVDLFKGRAIY